MRRNRDLIQIISILKDIINISSHIHTYICQVSVLAPDISHAGRAGRTGSAKKGEAILMVDEKEFARKRHRLLTEALPSVRSCLYDVCGWERMPADTRTDFGVLLDLDKIG